MSGAPGTVKTFSIEQFAKSTGWHTGWLNFVNVGATHIHETSKIIHETFERARLKSPSILVIDEADALLNSRDKLDSNQEYKVEEVSALLQCIQKARENKILVICMTNYPENIDPAMLREGRLGAVFNFSYPDEKDTCELLTELLKNIPKNPEMDFSALSHELSGMSLARISPIVEKAKRRACDSAGKELTMEHMKAAMDECLKLSFPADTEFSLPGNQEVERYVNREIMPYFKKREYCRKVQCEFPVFAAAVWSSLYRQDLYSQ